MDADAFREDLPAFDDCPHKCVALGPAAVDRQRFDLVRIFRRQPQADRAAERQAADVRPRDPRGLHKCGDVVGKNLGRVLGVRLLRFTGSSKVE